MNTLVAAAVRINDRLAETARRERSSVTFICECGTCDLALVPIPIDEFDEMRAREEPVLAPGH